MINGKFLRKSLSILLAAVLLVAMCAICFGTFVEAYSTYGTLTYDFDNKTGISGYTTPENAKVTTGYYNGYVTYGDNTVFNVKQDIYNGNSVEIGKPDTVTGDGSYNADALSLKPGASYTVTFEYRLKAGTTLFPDTSTANVLRIQRYYSANAMPGGLGKTGSTYWNIANLSDGTWTTTVSKHSFGGTEYDVHTLSADSDWKTATLTFTAPTSFTVGTDGSTLQDRLCLVFSPCGSSFVTDDAGNKIDYLIDMEIDNMTLSGPMEMTGAVTYVYDWKKDDGTKAYTDYNSAIALSDSSATNGGLTDAMKSTSGLTDMGMIVGGATGAVPTAEPSATIGENAWYHKAVLFDDAYKNIGGSGKGAVKLEANTYYSVTVKYIPLSVFDGKTGGLAIGAAAADNSYQAIGFKKVEVSSADAAYAQTAVDNVADRDTFDTAAFDGKTYKQYAEEYIAANGWQYLNYEFTLGSDYAPTMNAYLALVVGTTGSQIATAGSCWLSQFLVESVTVSVASTEGNLVKFKEGQL